MITAILDALVWPFTAARHTLGLVWLSLLAGAVMALVFRATTRPDRIRAAKNRFKSHIYEMRIYQHSPLTVASAFFQSLWSNMLYLRSILAPVLILVVPTILLVAQLEARYGAGHLPEGALTVLTVRLAAGTDPLETEALLDCAPGAAVDAGPVRLPGRSEISWRVRIEEAGTHKAALSIGGAEYPLRFVAEPGYRMIGRARGTGRLDPLLRPGLPPMPAGSRMEHVRIDYPRAAAPLLFWRTHWIAVFLFYAAVGAAAVKVLLGFEI